MVTKKFNRLTLALAVVCLPVLGTSGCVTVKNTYESFTGLDKSTRETTGYYDHEDSRLYHNTIVVPGDLDNPGTNPELAIVKVDEKSLRGPIGEAMDIRPPTTQIRSDIGCHTEWVGNEAIVWFDPDGSHSINTEDDAWMLLASVLKNMKVAVGKVADGQYVLTTVSRDFTEYGKPYDSSDADAGLKRYNQIYQLRVGRNTNGSLGIATRLMSSSTALSNGKKMKDLLSIIEQERFAMGFSNFIIHEIDNRNTTNYYDPENLVVTLGEDNNKHLAIFVEAPFATVTSLLESLIPISGWRLEKHSVANAIYEIEVLDSNDDWFKYKATKPLAIRKGNYKIRVGIQDDKVGITFYDDDDHPLSVDNVSKLYPGFAESLVELYKEYLGASANKVKAN